MKFRDKSECFRVNVGGLHAPMVTGLRKGHRRAESASDVPLGFLDYAGYIYIFR